ncbi:MAG: Dephospho-CoA kinase [Promethearchaeota archaeon]|nr:MAG: Dephospho-CoA kinase [Candidatus Lokiarchaeota archaeon]
MKEKKIIGFCGLPGSGKSTALEAVENLGEVIIMGDVVRNEASNRDIKPSDKNLGKIAKELREEEGPTVIAKRCIEEIKDSKNNVFFIDGLRSVAELQEFRKHWDFPLINISLKEGTRIKRIKERGRKDDSQDIKEIKRREEREKGFGLEKLLEKADYEIINNSTKAILKQKTRNLVQEILKKERK